MIVGPKPYSKLMTKIQILIDRAFLVNRILEKEVCQRKANIVQKDCTRVILKLKYHHNNSYNN